MARIAWLMVLLAVMVETASACPPGPCNKYRPHTWLPAQISGYTHRAGTRMPRLNRARIRQFLAESFWDPMYAVSPSPDPGVRVMPPPAIRFVDARNVRRSPVPVGTRRVLIRRIEIRDGEALIDVDGEVFVLERCDAQLPGACLIKRDDLSFDDPPQDAQFATPPR